MTRIILVYGAISGLIVILTMITGFTLSGGQGGLSSEWFGYLVMLAALSLIFFGIKRYRDRELGGSITFGKGFLVGLGIALVAGIAYVMVWEVYLSVTDYEFVDIYRDNVIEAMEAAGATDEEIDTALDAMENFNVQYANPLFRIPITLLEILPLGLLIALISAGTLRNPNALPAKAQP